MRFFPGNTVWQSQTVMQRQRGFTLIELLVTLVVVGILTTLAMPSMRDFLQNSRISSSAGNLVAALNQARAHAIARGFTVQVSAGAGIATTDAVAGASWAGGWRVIEINGATRTLVTQVVGEGTASNITIAATRAAVAISNMSFQGNGRPSSGVPVSWTVCDSSRAGERGRTITVTALGQVSNPGTTASSYVNPCT